MAVCQELTDPSTPAVRGEIAATPSWLGIREVRDATAAKFPARLHRGEREAMLLAEEIQPDFLLIDDQAARTAGRSRSLPAPSDLGCSGTCRWVESSC
jgi:predicted nucleic acid-binding protein